MNEIICGKSEDVIDTLPSNSVNLIISSPPYNVDLGNNKFKKDGYDEYEDNKDHEKFLDEVKLVFDKAKRVLTDDGRVVINTGNTKNGRIPTAHDTVHFMTKELRYKMYTTIIWNKLQTSNRTAWGSFNSPSFPSFPTSIEYILVFAKNSLKLTHKGISDLDKQEFIKWSYSYWDFQPETNMSKYDHPAMFPVELPTRCIKLFTYKGDTILDPYSGAGTTCYAAKLLERNYIGIDMSEKYCETARKRLARVKDKKALSNFFDII